MISFRNMKLKSYQKELRRKFQLRTEAKDSLRLNKESLKEKKIERNKRQKKEKKNMQESCKQKRDKYLIEREKRKKKETVMKL